MATTTRTRIQGLTAEPAATLKWTVWPLADERRWAWCLPIVVLAVGLAVWNMGGGGLLPAVAVAGLALTLRHFLLPVSYEITPLGIRRQLLRRSRLVPWHAVHAYQLRPTGVVLYRRINPTKFDLLQSVFVPYPSDPDELLVAIRPHLTHAVELPL